MPPSEASAPGSIGKNTPWSRRCSLSCLRVTPGSMTQSRSSAMHGENAVHVAEIEADAAARRVDLAFERGAGAERDHRHAVRRAQPHDVLHLFGRLRKHHRIRRLVVDPGRGMAVLLAHRLRGDEPVAEARGERGDRRCRRPCGPVRSVPELQQEPFSFLGSSLAFPLSRAQRGGAACRGQAAGSALSRALRERCLSLACGAVNPPHSPSCSIAPTPNPSLPRRLCPR